MINRETWGALPGAVIERQAWPAAPVVVVHHTVTPALAVGAALDDEYAAMRSIDRQHRYGNGWSGGIGYSFVVMPSGRVYVGRGWDTVGAHAPGANHLPGVALYGTFTVERPSGEALAALGALAFELTAKGLRGHRDFYATACPGNVLYGLLPAVPIIDVEAPPLPGDRTLRLMVRGHEHSGAPWAGWQDAEGPLRWVARHGLKARPAGAPDHWLAFDGRRYVGAAAVTREARRLVRDFLADEGLVVRDFPANGGT